MGQKVNPHGLRIGIIKDWDSVWYAERDFSKLLLQDHNIRKYLTARLTAQQARISRIVIKRTADKVKVFLHTPTPGIIIGRNGQAIQELTQELQDLIGSKVDINIHEIKRPELDSKMVAEDIAKQLEARVTFRRAMKQAMTRTMKSGAKGIKTAVSGRLGGADIARTEHYHEGTIPLQTLRADIDYGFAEANTTYGKLGVKVWIYKGEVLPQKAGFKEEVPQYANAKKGQKKETVSRPHDRPRSKGK
ncbi:MAG: 30S ribosomal protein S3 [Turicibacter sp.]|nr:30S ribosomal protein S3 [Turicibacter sp.]